MKILILGGTGFLGREAAISFFKRGDKVSVFSRGRSPADLPPGINRLYGDRRRVSDLKKAADGNFDVVLDNIGFSGSDAEAAAGAFRGKTGIYFFISASAVYSMLRGARPPYAESDAEKFGLKKMTGDPRESGYAAGKLEAERILGRRLGCVSFRLPAVVGPGDPSLRAHSYWLRIKDGGPLLLPGKAFLKRSFFYYRDLFSAVRSVLESGKDPRGRVFNLADDRPLSLAGFVRLSAGFSGASTKIIRLKDGEPAKFGLAAPGAFPYSNWEYPDYRDYLSCKEFKRSFSWKSSDIAQWLPASLLWFMRKYKGPLPPNYRYRREELTAALDILRRGRSRSGKSALPLFRAGGKGEAV